MNVIFHIVFYVLEITGNVNFFAFVQAEMEDIDNLKNRYWFKLQRLAGRFEKQCCTMVPRH